jgi:co-chaperonin GroES (HSP10)
VMDERFQQRIDSVEDKKTYKAHIDQVYCVIRKGEPVMLQDFIFVEPVIEPEENYMTSYGLMIKPEPEVMEREGVVKYVNEFSEDLGVKVGDHIYFESGCNYEIDVEGKKYYRMRNENVLFKYE